MIDAPAPYRVDKGRARASFDRAAGRYDEVAVLQAEVGRRLVGRLEGIRLDPAAILDLGAGTGRCSAALAARYPAAWLAALDFAPAMLARARARVPALAAVGGDVEALPLADASFDLVLSNLTLQWCDDPEATFAGLLRVVRPGGLLLFTTFGPDTLGELRAAWGAADGHNHVNAFFDMHDIGDALLRAGWGDPVMDGERLTVTYREAAGLLADLKTMGAHNVTAGRPRGLTGRARLAAMTAAYERFRRPDGLLPASYEVIYGHAWRPAAARPAGRGEPAAFPLEALRRTLRGGPGDD